MTVKRERRASNPRVLDPLVSAALFTILSLVLILLFKVKKIEDNCSLSD